MFTFSKAKFLVILTLAGVVFAQNKVPSTPPEQEVCAKASSNCISCINLGCAWAGDSCVQKCDSSGASTCHSPRTLPGFSVNAICMKANEDKLDQQICGSASTCEQCTNRFKAFGRSTCTWYADENQKGAGYCGIGGRNSNGKYGSSDPKTCAAPSTNKKLAGASELQVSAMSKSVMKPNISPPNRCHEALTCGGCVADGCAWASGKCIDSCSDVADPSCKSYEIFPQKNSKQICELTNSPLVSRGNTKSIQQAISKMSPPMKCQEALTCGDCVPEGCAWVAGQCVESCSDIADASSCYSYDIFPQLNHMQICGISLQEEGDSDACDVQTDCASCTSASLSNGNGCYWHSEVDACKPVLSDAWSTGTDVCVDEEDKFCSEVGSNSCVECLQVGCGWLGGSCVSDCSNGADAICYQGTTFPDLGLPDICDLAAEFGADNGPNRSLSFLKMIFH